MTSIKVIETALVVDKQTLDYHGNYSDLVGYMLDIMSVVRGLYGNSSESLHCKCTCPAAWTFVSENIILASYCSFLSLAQKCTFILSLLKASTSSNS